MHNLAFCGMQWRVLSVYVFIPTSVAPFQRSSLSQMGMYSGLDTRVGGDGLADDSAYSHPLSCRRSPL